MVVVDRSLIPLMPTFLVLPKQNSIFTIVLPLEDKKTRQQQQELSVDIFGDSFAYRSAERVSRKWKAGTGAGGVELI